MEPEVKTDQKPVLVRMAEQLLKDQVELDALALQFSLGKAEVKDKFEETKKQLKKSILEFRETLASEFKLNKEWTDTFKLKLTELENQLSKGRAESKVMFDEQKKAILKELGDLKNEMRKNPEARKLADYFASVAGRTEVQLDLFERKMAEGKKELTREFQEEMKKAGIKINSLLAGLKERKEDADFKLSNFSDEIRLSYDHLKKAIREL